MRLEFGALSVVVEGEEEWQTVLRSLLRLLNNKEVGRVLGVTDRTVRRWKEQGRLPGRTDEQVMLLDLLYLVPPDRVPAALRRSPGRPVESRAAHGAARDAAGARPADGAPDGHEPR